MFFNHQLSMVNVPNFTELSGKAVLSMIEADPRFTDYLPDLQNLKKPLNRQFLYNVSAVPVSAQPLGQCCSSQSTSFSLSTVQ